MKKRKVYVIASNANMEIAKRILDFNSIECDIFKVTDKLTSYSDFYFRKDKIENADIIMIMVDHSFSTSKLLNYELNVAIQAIQNNPFLLLLLIRMDDADLPLKVRDRIFYEYSSFDDKEELPAIRIESYNSADRKESRNYGSDGERSTSRSKIGIAVLAVLAIIIVGIVTVCGIQIWDIWKNPIIPQAGETNFIDECVQAIILLYAAVFLVLSIFSLFSSWVSVMHITRSKDEKNPDNALVQDGNMAGAMAQQGGDVGYEPPCVLERMKSNLMYIREHYEWSQNQAKLSFKLSVCACVTGVSFIFLALLFLVYYNKWELSVIPALAGGVVELIAGTALFVYRKSLEQLNYYYKALHENERYLSSVDLVRSLSTSEVRDKMLEQIIQSEIQMNMIETDKNYAEKKTTDS